VSAPDKHPSNSNAAQSTLGQNTKPHSRLIGLLKRFPQRLVWALFVLAMGFISIAILAGVAMFTRTPFVFPSLGPYRDFGLFSPHVAQCFTEARLIRTRNRDFVRLRIRGAHGTPTYRLANGWQHVPTTTLGGGTLSGSNRIFHGLVQGSPCARRGHNSPRFGWG